MAPLVLENITKTFRQGQSCITALAGVSLTVEEGQFLAIMGPSGSGKSTLLHVMAGLTPPDGGRVLVRGQDLAALCDRELTVFRRRNIGLVFQSFNLIPTLSARENLALPLLLDGVDAAQAFRRVERLMEVLNLADRAAHRPDVMSGGEQQRLAIGRALVIDPAVILADEPTGNLDSASSQKICCLLRDLCCCHGRTIVLVTHEPAVASYARRILVMKDGRLVDCFAPSEVGGIDGVACSYQRALKSGPEG